MSEPSILFPDSKPLPHHRDKNGREIRYNRLLHDNGKVYDLFGTGMKMPGDGTTIKVWTPDNKLAILDTRDVVAFEGWFSHWLDTQSRFDKWCLVGAFLFLLALAFWGVGR